MKFFSRLYAIFLILAFLSSSAFAQNKDWLIKMQDPNVNFWELQNEFNDYWNNRTDFKGNGYKVFKRWEYINEVRVLSNGKLPAPDYVMNEYERYMAEAPVLKSASGTWNIIGPTTYPSNNTGQPTGKGRINAIAFHPSDPNTIYIGAPSGGIWKSTNGGANWSSLSANIPYLGVSAILIHPSNPDIIYIGTGDRDSDDAPGVGVYKSTDGGATWAPANAGMGNTTIGMMVMHPSDPNTILAATYDGIFKTTNGGVTWTLTRTGDFRDIKFKPGDPTVMYATRMITPSEFYRSTDGGSNWTLITTPTSGVGSRMVIGVSPANAAYVYLVQIKAADATFKALLRSTDSGQTFSEQSSTPNIFDYACNGSGTSSQATYDLCIEVDQTDEDIVYVGSINSWKSTNGGVNWSPVSHWVGSGFAPGDPTANCAASVHADHHWYQWSPHHSPARLYLGHDGGIAYTANGGTTWTDITTDLPIGQVYKVGQAAQTVNTILAGFQDNGVSATSNGASFTTIGGGDGFECIVDYSNSNFCYQASQNGNMRRSTTGVFGSYSNTFNGLVTDNAAFSTPYILHRTNPNIMFMGRENVWRSTNIKATPATSVTWEAISSFAAGTTIRVVAQSPANLNILYISRGTGPGSAVYRSDNANAAANSVVWNAITKPGGYTVTDIKAHPTDPNTVYATANMQVFKSTDKGVTWTDITGNLPALFTNCLAIDEGANEGIYVGNQTGVWYKDATISEWILFSSGMPPVDVRELEIYYDANPDNSRITAATYGRGIWQSDLAEINVVNPSNLAATTFSSSQIDLSWTLNASSDNVLIATSPTTIFGVPADGTAYTAGNSLPGGGTVVYVGNLTNFSHTGLNPNATYCYKIWSVNGSNQYSAGLTPVCTNTYSDWTGNVNTDWFNTGNWGSGAVPTSLDAAYIPAGRPNYPVINAAGATCYHLIIASGASVSMDASTSYTLQVTGDWENNGTFNRGVGTVEFNGTNELQTIKGTSASDFYILRVAKSSTNNILDAVSPITLNAAVDAPLSLATGTFRLSNAASTITAITANGQTSDNALGTNKRIWVNAGTLNINSRWRINAGELRISGGTVNVGNANNMELDYLNNGAIILQGGALNVSAGVWGNATSSTGSIQISAGTITLGQFFNGFNKPMLEATPNCGFTMSGGTIIIRRRSSGSSAATDVFIQSLSASVTGGTLQIGNATTPVSQVIRITNTVPVYNLTVNATNAPTAQLLTNNLTVKNDLTISGGTLNANGLNLNVGGHWSNSGTFTPGTGTVTFDGTANQNLAGSTATTFNNLALNNSAGLTLSGSVNATVNGTLTLTSGVITTGSNKAIISPSGSVTRTSGHIFGNLQKNIATGSNISRTFEIGDATAANYTPVAVTFASVSSAGNLTAQSVAGDHPQIGSATLNASKSVNRYWSLIDAGTTFTTCDAVFNFLTTDLDPSVNTSNLIGGKYNAPNWTYPAMGIRTANSTEITGVASFSDFQLAEAPCINPDVPTLAATVNPTCAGQPTDLSISSGNLNGAAVWQWYSGSCGGTPVGTGANLTVSPTTTTTYYARGEGGCVVTPGVCGSITLTVNPLPTAAITGNLSYCAGGNTTLTASGGVSYEWSNGDLTAATTVTAGTYTVTVTDANGCEDTETATVTENPLPTAAITGNLSYCASGNTTLTASGGVSYEWSNGDLTAATTVTAGTYTVTVTDANGCEDTETATVTENPLPTAAITGNLSYCAGGNTTLTASGGVSYEWSNGDLTAATTVTAGTYTVTVTDANGCEDTETATVTENPLPTASISGNLSYCAGGNTTLTASGGVSYEWSNGDLTAATTVTAGTYTVTVTDANGCEDTETATVTENPLPTASISGNLSYCAGGNTTLTASGGVSYEWSNGDLTAATTVTAGTYTVTVTDANGCEDTESATVTENALPTVTLNDPADVCIDGADMNFTGTPTDANGVFTTTAGAGFTDNGDGTAVLDVSAAGPGTYDVTYMYTDGNSCSASQTVSVTVTTCAINFTGRIIWEGDYLTTMTGVNDADVTLSGDDSDTDVSNVTGNYSLDATTGSNFEIKPVKNKPIPSAMNGLTAADASRTQQHVIGAFPFASPYKVIAADINKTNSVTAQDANLISQALLGNPIAQDMFINTTWRFVPKSYVFPVPAAPWGFPEKIVLTGVSGSMSGLDFIGAKLGDVNNTANPANLIPVALPHLIWKVQDRVLKQDAEFVAEFNAHDFDDLLALQFALSFDAAKIQLLDIETISGSPMGMDNFGTYNVAAGEIRALLALAQTVSVPDGTPVFRLKFKVLQGGDNLSDVLQLSHDVLAGEAYKSDFTPGPVSLVFDGTTTGTNAPDVAKLILLQNRPNPFVEHTTIAFILPGACEATLRVFDVNSRLLREHTAWFPEGKNAVDFDLTGNSMSGVLYYELTTPFGVLVKKMVAMKN